MNKALLSSLSEFARFAASHLRINDWDIDIKFVDESGFAKWLGDNGESDPVSAAKGSLGACDITSSKSDDTSRIQLRTAKIAIKVLESSKEQDLQITIVHELMHIMLCHFCPRMDDSIGIVEFEKAMNVLDNLVARQLVSDFKKTKKSSR